MRTCTNPTCPHRSDLLTTPAELRARDERIIRAAWRYIHKYDPNGRDIEPLYDVEELTIIAAAEADQ